MTADYDFLDFLARLALLRDFPEWAVWHRGGQWVAARAPGTQVPSPDSVMLWTRAYTVDDLTDRMRAVDAQL